MNQLSNAVNTISSVEVAEMMGVNHWEILRKLDGTKTTKGIIEILNDNKIVVVDYFCESSYADEKGELRKSYNCTKLGCEFLANKFTGEKGILFTTKYVKRFNDMENHIKSTSQVKPELKKQFEMNLLGVEYAAKILRLDTTSQIKMLETAHKNYGVPTNHLPIYVDEEVAK